MKISKHFDTGSMKTCVCATILNMNSSQNVENPDIELNEDTLKYFLSCAQS